MFELDRFKVFAAVDERRGIVVYQMMAMGGGSEDPGGEVWFIEIARSTLWAFQFERRRASEGEYERVARLRAGRGDLPDDAYCRSIVADYVRFEEDRLNADWPSEGRVQDIIIKVSGFIHSGTFAEEADRYPVTLYGF